jgi:hypothetical protein
VDPNEIALSPGPVPGEASSDGQWEQPILPGAVNERGRSDPAAGCQCQRGAGTLVYAIGQIGCGLSSQSRYYSFVQKIRGGAHDSNELRDFDRLDLLEYLDKSDRPWEAEAMEWTLQRDGIPIYILKPEGAFAAHAYREFRRILARQLKGQTQWVAVPGHTVAATARVAGRPVPALVPDLRGLCDWSVKDLTAAVKSRLEGEGKDTKELLGKHLPRWTTLVGHFLERVYNGSRSLGLTPEDRALNYAATDAYQAGSAILGGLRTGVAVELDHVRVRRSPMSHPRSACCDIELYFSKVDLRHEALQRAVSFTVDVSDVVPVTVGGVRGWWV